VYLDSVIADLLGRAPSDTTTILVGDHGMLPIRTKSSFADATLSGGHLKGPAAFFVAAGPSIRRAKNPPDLGKIKRRNLPLLGSILDIAPTVLALRGIAVGRDMQGDPMVDILDPKFLKDFPIRKVRSHTDRGWFESRDITVVENADPSERLEQLRTLGYLD
jgi:hypothetical protein